MERLRQSGVSALSNAFGMAAFLESKQNLLCDHPSLFIICHYIYIHVIIFIDIDNQIDIEYIHACHVIILIPMPFCCPRRFNHGTLEPLGVL